MFENTVVSSFSIRMFVNLRVGSMLLFATLRIVSIKAAA